METSVENVDEQLSEMDHELSSVSCPDSSGLAKEAAKDSFVGNGIEGGRLDVSPALQMMVDELENVRLTLLSYHAENTARLKVFENLRAAIDASVQKVSERGETLQGILLDVGNVLDTFNNTEELPTNMEDNVLELFEKYAILRKKNPKVDESLCLIAEVHQVVAERKNTRAYIKRFCDYLRGTVLEPVSNFQPRRNGTGRVGQIDPIPHGDKYGGAGDQNDEDEDHDDVGGDDDDGYCESYASNDTSIHNDTQATVSANGKISGKYNFVRVDSEAKDFTREEYDNCAVVFCKMGRPLRSLSSESSNNSAIVRALSSPGENFALWFLDSMWYPSSRSAAGDLERLEKLSGKTYHLREIFGHLTVQCLAYVDLTILEKIGTVYKGTEDKEFLDFVTKFVMKNYFVPRSLRQLHLAIPPQTPLALLDPLHPGLYRGVELHLHFPRLSTEEDANWMMDVCRKLVHKFPCELRDVRGFYFKECRLSESRVKGFMKFLDGEFLKTKLVCVDQQTEEACDRQQRLYEAMGFTFYDKAEDGLMDLNS